MRFALPSPPHSNTFLTHFFGVLTVCTLTSCPAMAESDWKKINFVGNITTQTCEVKITGTDGLVVTLPEVRDTVLAKVGDRAGLTTFTLRLEKCSHAEDGVQKVLLSFHAPQGQGRTPTGNLENTTKPSAGGATSVALQVTKDEAGNQPLKLPRYGESDVSLELDAQLNDSIYTHTFGVQYYRFASAPLLPGKFTASIEWRIAYL